MTPQIAEVVWLTLQLPLWLLFQWECKADMDNAFRFGNIEVVCEGYSYPEDPYILKGSCGVSANLACLFLRSKHPNFMHTYKTLNLLFCFRYYLFIQLEYIRE